MPGGEVDGLVYFRLGVEELIEDSSSEWEDLARIVVGPRFAPLPDLTLPSTRATLDALAAKPLGG